MGIIGTARRVENCTSFHHPLSRKHIVPDMAGERHYSACFFSSLALSLLTFTAVMHPVAGDMCDGLGVELHNEEAALACPLKVNVFDTKHSIMIKLFKEVNSAENVLGCDWLSSKQKFDCLGSPFNAELIRIEADRVLARLTKDRLGNGTYRCQLVPPNVDNYLTDCDICGQDSPTGNPTTQSSVTPSPSTPAGHLGSNYTREKARVWQDEHHGELVTANVVLSFIVFCLLVVIAAMVIFFLRNTHVARSRNTSSSKESNGTENTANSSLLMPSKATPGLEDDKRRMSDIVSLNLYPDINYV